jgi:Mrp family chromosome partitioning ATPase
MVMGTPCSGPQSSPAAAARSAATARSRARSVSSSDHGVEVAVEALDALEVKLEDRDGGKLCRP